MGALILFLLACAWAPSQPLIVEVSLGDTDRSCQTPEAGDPRSEAVDPKPEASPEAGGAAREADSGVGGDHDR